MPTVHRIDSIKIMINFRDHLPPHFHSKYNEYEVLIEIETLEVYSGYLPGKQMNKVIDWATEHQEALMDRWNDIHNDNN